MKTIWVKPSVGDRYVLESQRTLPPEEQTVWLLRGLTAPEYEERKDRVRAVIDKTLMVKVGAWQLYTLRRGIVGIDGAKGPIPFAKVKDEESVDFGLVTDEFLTSIHPDERRELASEVERLSTLSVDAVKG